MVIVGIDRYHQTALWWVGHARQLHVSFILKPGDWLESRPFACEASLSYWGRFQIALLWTALGPSSQRVHIWGGRCPDPRELPPAWPSVIGLEPPYAPLFEAWPQLLHSVSLGHNPWGMAAGNCPGLGTWVGLVLWSVGKREEWVRERVGRWGREREREMIMRVRGGRKGEREGGWGGGREGLNVDTSCFCSTPVSSGFIFLRFWTLKGTLDHRFLSPFTVFTIRVFGLQPYRPAFSLTCCRVNP